jgi:hypothetical protein
MARSARVRPARLTDLAALGELSRLTHTDRTGPDRPVRSLGLPIDPTHISVFSLFRFPLGAFRVHDLLYVHEDEDGIDGLLRVERDGRDDWTIVELDAIGYGDAGDIRYRLLQHLLRDSAKRGAARIHVACADGDGNVELFMQLGFARYGQETILYRPPEAPPVPSLDEAEMDVGRIRLAVPLDALPLLQLYQRTTPHPVARLEAYRLPDWERQGREWRIPRSSLTPILRFADVEAYVEECPPPVPGVAAGGGGELAAFLQVGVAKEDQPHYLKVISRPDHDPAQLIRFGLGLLASRKRDRHDHGVVCAVRTYESPLDRRLEEVEFQRMATVSLLLKETLVRVREPALVPAVN